MNRRGKLRSETKSLQLLALAASIALATSSWAQDNVESTDEEDNANLGNVVVTGSRIARTDVEGPSPVTILTADQMDAEGFTTVFEALNTLTQAYGNTQDDQFSGGFTQNANVVDLRGLGPGRTLILINGRRTTDYPLPFNGQSNIVNLNSIPVAAVQRVEILSGGASAIYGSDAVAGVINVVMKENIEDTSFNLRLGDTTEGGGESIRAQVVGGFDFDRGNITYAFEYFDREPIWGFERDYADSINDNPDGPPFVNTRSLLALDVFDAFNTASTGFRYIDPSPQACTAFDDLEHSFRPGAGNFCGRDDDVSQFTVRNATENYSIFLNGNYELTNSLEAYSSFNYITKDAEFNTGTLFWQNNLFGPNSDGQNSYSNLDNVVEYDFSAFGLGVIQAPQVVLMQRIFTAQDMGGQEVNNQQFEEDSFDVAFGLRGSAGARWNWDFNISHSEYDLERNRRLILADEADAFFAGAPLNTLQPDAFFGGFFANLGDLADPNNRYNRPLTAAEFQSISGIDTTRADSSSTNATLLFSGDLLDMPAGALAMATTLEWGTQEYDITLDPRLVAGQFWGFTGTGGGGERDRYAAGVEFLVPVFDQLVATLAGRYDEYDDITDVDDAFTYGLGLEYRPTRNLLVRGRFATSFRAPDMHFVFADPSGFFTSAPDYFLCQRDEGFGDSNVNNCTNSNVSIQGSRSGNPGLQEEEGESITLGFVWEIMDGLSVSADYYEIDLDNIVNDRSVDRLLRDERNCRLGQSGRDINSAFCQDVVNRIVRFPADGGLNSEALVSVATGPINRSVQDTKGVDASFNYTLATDRAGVFRFDTTWSHVLDQRSAEFPEDPVLSFRDTTTQDFRSRMRGSVSWAYEKFNATVFFNRLGSTLTNDSLFRTENLTRIGPQIYYNLNMGYQFNDNLSLSLIGNNILNKEPPQTTEELYPYYNIFSYDPYGRELFVQLEYTLD